MSDTCSAGEKIDGSGPKLETLIRQTYNNSEVYKKIISDDKSQISKTLTELCEMHYDVIFTTGGTGLSPRDVTPEATREIIEKEIVAITNAILISGLQKTPMAMLSR